MFDIPTGLPHQSQAQPSHRNLPRRGPVMPFPEQGTDNEARLPCPRPGETEHHDAIAERIHTRWARHLAQTSHELRTPLTGITGFAALLDGPDLSGQQRQLVQRITDCSQTMLALVNDLLDEALAQSGDIRMVPKPYSPAQVARDCTALVAAANYAGSPTLSCRIDPAIPDVACGDALRLRQILTNLLVNAVASAAGPASAGKVQLVLRRRGTRKQPKLVWSVVDNGTGLSAEERRKIFEPFERGPGAAAGTGLGLAIAGRLAKKMGGQITVRSAMGRGSIFSLHLPLRQAGSLKVPLAQLRRLNLPRILVVQSCTEQWNLTQPVLEIFGFAFDRIGAAAEVMTMLRAAELADHPYIALLMDIDGINDAAFPVLRTLRRAGMTASVLPAFALSAGTDQTARKRIIDAGFQNILTRPLIHAEFAQLGRILIAPSPAQAASMQAAGHANNFARYQRQA